MNESSPVTIDPIHDLLLERTVPVAVEKIWQAWTNPEKLMKWFCPLPWKTVECEIDLRPGGIFKTIMQGPEGESPEAGAGCYLEIIENRKLVWTSALGPGFRPQTVDGEFGFLFTCILTFEPTAEGTKYRAHVLHAKAEDKDRHEAMGFHDGWGTAFDQLIAMVQEEAA